MILPDSRTISIIIPTLNEAEKLPALLTFLKSHVSVDINVEIIVSDGGSNDETVSIAMKHKVIIHENSTPHRAKQLNAGASIATGEVLYFLHADSLPPTDFIYLVMQQVKNDFQLGCFRLKFDHPHWFLRANAWFSRFSWSAFHFGDQSLFITKKLFNEIGGYNEKLFLNEDQEIIIRAKRKGNFVVIPAYIVTSARKYLANGILRLQFIFYLIYFLYQIGFSPLTLGKLYKKWIK